jgi:C4-dicarboxylate transporter DctM subunit
MIELLVILLIILLLFAFPIFLVLLVPTIAVLLIYFPHLPTYIVAQRMISGVSPFVLVAIPLFIFMAEIIKKGDSANRLTNMVLKIVGHTPGGLAQAYTGSCILFGAVSGSTQATVAAIGGTMHPTLLKKGYSEAFTLALIVNSSDVAILIPPSVVMIMYGVVTGASVGEMFIAGVGPGVALGLAFMTYTYFYAKYRKLPLEKKATFKEILVAMKNSLWAFGFPIIIIGGIYSGSISPTEAAAVAVVYAIFLETVVYKKVKLREIPALALQTGKITAVIYVIVAAGMALSWLITVARIPQTLQMALMGPHPSALEVILWSNLFFFVALMFVSPMSAIIVLTPLFYKIALTAGVDPIHLGILITLNAAIGSATPPFGVDLFTACAIFNKSLRQVAAGVFPFIGMGVVVLLLLTFFPGLALFLRDLAFR